MSASFIIVLLLIVAQGVWPGMVFALIASHLMLSACLPQIHLLHFLLFSSLLCSIPVAAWIAGRMLDQCIWGSFKSKSFTSLASALCFSLLFASGGFIQWSESALGIFSQQSPVKLIALFSVSISAALYCAGLVTLSLVLLIVACELPIRWLNIAYRGRAFISYEAIRPLLLLLVCAMGVHLIVGLFVSELNPLHLLGV